MMVRQLHNEASYQACILSSMSIPTPKAFSIRSAISGDSAAWPFSKSESVSSSEWTHKENTRYHQDTSRNKAD